MGASSVPEMTTEWERADKRALDHVGRSLCDHYDRCVGITCEESKK